MKQVSSRKNAVVESFRDAARGESPLLLLDGEHLVQEALDAGYQITHLIVALDRRGDSRLDGLIHRADAAHADILEGTAAVMDAVSPVRSPSAIVALARRPKEENALFTSDSPFIVVACDVQDPGNIGAMIRVAEGAGASGFIAAGGSADPFGWKALRGSMGSSLRLPIARRTSVQSAIDDVRTHGCRIVATVPGGGTPFFELDLTQATALLIGGEGRGLDERAIADADDRATIPMAAPVESLNAAVATALIVYEARRQRS